MKLQWNKRLKILEWARWQAYLCGLLGLLAGLVYSVGGLLVDTLVSLGLLSGRSWETPGLSYGTLLAFGALLGMPLLFAAAGFGLGLLQALIFNLLFNSWAEKQ